MFNNSKRVNKTTQGAVKVSPTVAWRRPTRKAISKVLWEGSEGLTCDNSINSSQSSKNHSQIEKWGQGSLTDWGHSSVVEPLSRMHDTLGSIPRATLSSLYLMLCEYMFLKTRPAFHVCVHGKIKKKNWNEHCGQNELSHQISKAFQIWFWKGKVIAKIFSYFILVKYAFVWHACLWFVKSMKNLGSMNDLSFFLKPTQDTHPAKQQYCDLQTIAIITYF